MRYHKLLYLTTNTVFESSGSIQIINGPRNTTGILGSTVTFPCEVEGTTDLPQWRINGTNYGVTSLPFWHWFTRRDGLSVYLASVEMNNTLYACLYYTYAPETGEELIILSEEALLTVYISELPSMNAYMPILLAESLFCPKVLCWYYGYIALLSFALLRKCRYLWTVLINCYQITRGMWHFYFVFCICCNCQLLRHFSK